MLLRMRIGGFECVAASAWARKWGCGRRERKTGSASKDAILIMHVCMYVYDDIYLRTVHHILQKRISETKTNIHNEFRRFLPSQVFYSKPNQTLLRIHMHMRMEKHPTGQQRTRAPQDTLTHVESKKSK